MIAGMARVRQGSRRRGQRRQGQAHRDGVGDAEHPARRRDNSGPLGSRTSVAAEAAAVDGLQRTGAADPAVGPVRQRHPGQTARRPTVNAPNERAAIAVRAALSRLGLPYVWGGTDPNKGMDCSGLTQWAYGQAGIEIPRTAHTQTIGPEGQPGRHPARRPDHLERARGHVHRQRPDGRGAAHGLGLPRRPAAHHERRRAPDLACSARPREDCPMTEQRHLDACSARRCTDHRRRDRRGPLGDRRGGCGRWPALGPGRPSTRMRYGARYLAETVLTTAAKATARANERAHQLYARPGRARRPPTPTSWA